MQQTDLSEYLDSTLLAPEATAAQVTQLVLEASQLGCYAVCVSPNMVAAATQAIADLAASNSHIPKLAAVCGFPSGKHTAAVKAFEAAELAAAGVTEIDMVIDIGSAIANDFESVAAEITAVRQAAPAPVVLKVIIESAALTREQIINACVAAQQAGADFVKTSTGFHPAGGATPAAVQLMAQTVGTSMGVKASGGIRTPAAAREMLKAGATRLGVSAAAKILEAHEADGSDTVQTHGESLPVSAQQPASTAATDY